MRDFRLYFDQEAGGRRKKCAPRRSADNGKQQESVGDG
jgi:hypothetical protein